MSEPPKGPIQGRIDPSRPIQTHLARALLPLVRSKRTGALQLTSGGLRPMRTQLVIADGHLVFAESEADTGRVLRKLVERGLLTANEAQRLERRVLEVGGWSGMVKATELAVKQYEQQKARFDAITAKDFQGQSFRGDRVVTAFTGLWTERGVTPPVPRRAAWYVIGADGKSKYLVGFQRFENATDKTVGDVFMRVKPVK